MINNWTYPLCLSGHLCAEQDHCRRFPGPASRDLRGGPRRNFQVFSALDFLAELTQHIPNKGEHLVRCYGWYSHRQRHAGQARGPSPFAGTARRVLGTNGDCPLSRQGTAYRPLGAGRGKIGRCRPARRFRFHLGHVDQTGLRGRSATVPQVRRRDEDHQLHRALSAGRGGADSPALRPVGRADPNAGHARAPPHGSRRCPDGPQFVPDPEFLESEYLERQADAACELQLVLDPDFL